MKKLVLALSILGLAAAIPGAASAQTMTEYIIIVAFKSGDFVKKTAAVNLGSYQDKVHGRVAVTCTSRGARSAPKCSAKTAKRGRALTTKVLSHNLTRAKGADVVLKVGKRARVTLKF